MRKKLHDNHVVYYNKPVEDNRLDIQVKDDRLNSRVNEHITYSIRSLIYLSYVKTLSNNNVY